MSVALTLGAAPTPAPAAAGSVDLVPLPPQPPGVPWPTDAWPEGPLPAGVDRQALHAAVEATFGARGRSGVPDTRALLLVQGGVIVFERYADGFGRDSRFQTWSMAKSFTQVLVGLLVARGRLDLDAPAPVPEWRQPGDPRGAITLRHMLHMTTGLDADDGDPGSGSFVGDLLFGAGARDINAFAAARPLLHPPGSHWAYSTATSSLVAGIVGRAVGDDLPTRVAFLHDALFDRIGMRSALFEFDAAGHFLGGSHLWATARDFARFGLLVLRDGVWQDERLLPEGWVDFARTPAPAANNGVYGGHFWLNLEPTEGQYKMLPGGPDSAFQAAGNGGQLVVLVPDRDLVLVRLGELQTITFDEINAQMAAVVAAVAAPIPATPIPSGEAR